MEITVLFNNQVQQLAVSQRSTTAPTPATGKVAQPELFDGLPKKLDIFLCKLYLNFEDDPSYFKADHMRKICFMLSYMKFKAVAQWASFVIGELETKTRSYKNWDEFCEQVKVAFRDHNKKDAAQWKLEQLKQGTRLAAEFFIEFEECKALAGYNDEGFMKCI